MRVETDSQDRDGSARADNACRCRGHDSFERGDQDNAAAAGGLSADAAVRSALECYRNALDATDEVEAGAWIRAGQWFERVLAGGEGTGTLSPGAAAGEMQVASPASAGSGTAQTG